MTDEEPLELPQKIELGCTYLNSEKYAYWK